MTRTWGRGGSPVEYSGPEARRGLRERKREEEDAKGAPSTQGHRGRRSRKGEAKHLGPLVYSE